MKSTEVDKLARVIWDYHHLNQPLKKADCILVLGSHDTRVAEYAVDLYLKGYAPYIIFAGGLGDLTKNIFPKPEAEIFADLALKHGVPKEKIIIENKSTNTTENVELTKRLLKSRGLDFNSFILVHKPYMERRTFATFRKCWPEKDFIVTSPPISFEDYPDELRSKEDMINIMVGDLQRVKIYAGKGWQITQEIPHEVWKTYKRLVELGYSKHLVKD